MLRPTLGALLLLALAASLAPAAQAGFSVEFPDHVGPLAAGSEQAPLRFRFTDDCPDLLARAGPGAQSVQVHLVPHAVSAYVLMAGPETGDLPLAPCLEGQPASAADVDWVVTLRPDAPGLEPLLASVGIQVPGPAPNPEPMTLEAAFRASAKPVLLVKVDSFPKLSTSRGDHVDVRLNVTNLSNVKANVAFAVVEAPRGSVRLPDPVAVDNVQGGLGNTREAVVRFDVPDGAWDRVGITLTATPSAFAQPDAVGEPTEIHLMVRNGNAFERAAPAAPAPPVPLALAGLALAALAVRRRA